MIIRGRVQSNDDDHRVTTFELFFDLVFVFAFTQLTSYMAHNHTAAGIVQAMLLLALFWWSWSAYAWLGNQANAGVGTVRAVMVVAMTAVFILALATPEAWHDAPGGLHGPAVLTAAYIVVRGAHQFVYLMAARSDAALQRQLVRNIIPLLSGIVLLVIGAAVGGTGQTVLWALALATDWGATYLTSRGGGGWRVNSRSHWVDRHGLEHELVWPRIVAAAALVASWPLLAAARPLVGMAIILAVLVAVVGVEVWRRERVFSSPISPPRVV